jgi:hypothetical protein
MANFKYFATCRGFTVQLLYVQNDMDGTKPENFFGQCPRCNERHTAERVVQFKAFPSLHRCDARCENAKGHNCECACGGANHGKGYSPRQMTARGLPLFAAAAAF